MVPTLGGCIGRANGRAPYTRRIGNGSKPQGAGLAAVKKNPQATDKKETMSSEPPATHPKATRLTNPRAKPIGQDQ